MDIIWGDMELFLQKIAYTQYDLVSTRPRAISGHFTCYRNTETLNLFYQKVPNYRQAFTGPNYQGFDEGFFSYHLYTEIQNGQLPVKPYWEKRNCIDRGELARHPATWFWKDGKVFNRWGVRGNYLHMIDWKKTLEEVNVGDPEQLNSFKISAYGIWKGNIPSKYRRKLLFRLGLRKQYHHWKNRFKAFVKHQLLQKKDVLQANVPDGYRTLH